MILCSLLLVALSCRPPPREDRPIKSVDCDAGQIAAGATCVPEDCGATPWGNLPVDGDTIYVDATAPHEGDGSVEAPFTTIQRGLGSAGSFGGGLVAVAAGTYRETLSFTKDHANVHLAGRCREMVILDASVGDGKTPGIKIDMGDGTADITGLTLKDSTYAGLWVDSGEVWARDLTISANAFLGVTVSSGVAGMTDLHMNDCLIEGNTGAGLHVATPGSWVNLVDTTVVGTQPSPTGGFGRGIEVNQGAFLSAEGCLVEDNTGYGLYALNRGTEVIFKETTVRGTQPDEHGEFGRGMEVIDEAEVIIEGCLIEGNTNEGIYASDMGTRVILRDTIIKDTQPNFDRDFGWGIEVLDGADLVAEDCIIDGNTSIGLLAANPGTQVTLSDTTVKDTHPNASDEGGRGIEVLDGAALSAEGCMLDGNSHLGLLAGQSSTQVILRETTVKGTLPNKKGEYGFGIVVADGAMLSTESCHIDENTRFGLTASFPGTRVILRNTTFSGTRSGIAPLAVAIGVSVQDGAFMTASQLEVLANEGPGILVDGPDAKTECVGCLIADNQFAGAAAIRGGMLTISDSTIGGTSPETSLLGGAGIYAQSWPDHSTTVNLSSTLIQDNPIAGVWLIGEGVYLLTGNTISGGIGEPFGSGARCGDAILALHGITAWDGRSGLALQDNSFRDASGAGVFLDDSSAWMTGNDYSGNAMDLIVQNQGCETVPDGFLEAPRRDLCPQYEYPTCRSDFF